MYRSKRRHYLITDLVTAGRPGDNARMVANSEYDWNGRSRVLAS